MTEAEKLFEKLGKGIPDVKPGKMFGALCLKTPNGKAAVMLWHDFLIVKLSPEQAEEVLGLSGTKIFEPVAGRKMGGWIQIPLAHKTKWKKYALISVEEVKKLKKK